MGEISVGLRKVLDMVKPEAEIPVIIRLSAPLSKEIISHMESLGFKVKDTVPTANMVFGKVRAGLVEQIARLPFVARIDYDELITAAGVPFFRITGKRTFLAPVSQHTTGKLLGVDEARKEFGVEGEGVKVAVLDTGADFDHPMIRENLTAKISMIENESAQDGNGHGTWCAATVAGVEFEGEIGGKPMVVEGMAPKAKLIIIKVLSNEGKGRTSYVIKGMEKAAELGADIISMSLGSIVSEAGRSPDAEMVDILSKKGILCVVAAGNSALPLSIGSPGDARGALTVGSVAYATPLTLTPSTFESRGPTIDMRLKPDVTAPGGNVLPRYAELLVSAGIGGGLKGLAGTSMATPHISGMAALLVEAGMPKDRDILEYVCSKTGRKRAPIPFKDTDYGWGVPNVYAAIDNVLWESKDAQTFNRISEGIQAITMPFAKLVEPVSMRVAEIMGVDMTPRLAVIE